MISYDLETNPLQIKTDSTSGSGEIVPVTLYTAGGESVGKIGFNFNSPPQYKLRKCA